MGTTVTSTVWIWKGIALKTFSTVSGMTLTDLATEIQENAVIVPTIFMIPEGVTFQ